MDGSVAGSGVAGFRLVTLCGSAGGKSDAMRDSQDLLEPRFRLRGIDVHPVDLGDWSLRVVPRLLREITRQQPNGILMQYPTGAFGHSLGPVAVGMVQRAAPCMVMLHEFVDAHPLRKAAVGGLLLRADRVGVTADRERQMLGRYYPWLRRRIRHVPIASNIPARTWRPAVPVRVAYFGQLRPNKGLEEFVACVDQVSGRLPGVRFQIIGAVIPGLLEYAAWVRAEATRRGVEVLVDLEPDKVADELASATVMLLPYPHGASFRRGTLFAAAANGVPVVSTFGPDTPDELRALIQGGRTLDEVVSLVCHLLQDGTVLRDAHKRSLALDSCYGWEKTVDHYVQVFREMAGLRRGASSPVGAAEPTR